MDLDIWNYKPVPFIKYIRERFPDTTWRYNKKARTWEGGDGSYVRGAACWAPRYDGDDDTFVTRYYRYFPDGRMAVGVW